MKWQEHFSLSLVALGGILVTAAIWLSELPNLPAAEPMSAHRASFALPTPTSTTRVRRAGLPVDSETLKRESPEQTEIFQ